MAPSRIRPGTEEMKPETTTTSLKERPTPTVGQLLAPNGKGRRQVSSTSTLTAATTTTSTTGVIGGKDNTGTSNNNINPDTGVNLLGNGAGGAGGASSSGGGQETAGTGIAWLTFDLPILHAYRHAYRLSTPSSFSSSLNHMILSNRGIGRYSPTMARARERRRVSQEQLALAVRKHFNGLGIQEGEVVVDFLYKVRWQNKEFRMRFGPRVTRS